MRVLPAILLCLAIVLSLVAADEDALHKWTDMAIRSRSGVINLNEKTFDQIITNDRNYTTIGN